MANLTLSVPDSIYKRMQRHNEIKWSVVVRSTISKKLDDLELMERIASKSRLTQVDADKIGQLIKSDIARAI